MSRLLFLCVCVFVLVCVYVHLGLYVHYNRLGSTPLSGIPVKSSFPSITWHDPAVSFHVVMYTNRYNYRRLSVKPKVVGVVVCPVIGPHSWSGSSRSVGSRTEHQCFERLQFGCKTGNVGTKFVVLFRRFVTSDQPFVDYSGIHFFLFGFRVIVHHLLMLLLLMVDANSESSLLLRRLLLLHVMLLMRMTRWRIGAHPHSLGSRLLLLMVRLLLLLIGISISASSADTATATESRRTARKRPVATGRDSGIAFVARFGRSPSAVLQMLSVLVIVMVQSVLVKNRR